jgi:hypothetical protein
VAAFRATGNAWGVADATCELAAVSIQLGDGEGAAAHYEEAIATSRAIGQKRTLAVALAHLAALRAAGGDVAGAVWHFFESFEILRVLDDPVATATALECVARVAMRLGLHRSAVWLAGTADTVKRSTQLPIPQWEGARRDVWLGQSRAALGPEAARKVSLEGAAMDRELAIDHARDLVASWTRPGNVPTEPAQGRRL